MALSFTGFSQASVSGVSESEIEACAEARSGPTSPDCIAVDTRVQDQAEKLNQEIVSIFIQENLQDESVQNKFRAKLDELFEVNKAALGKKAAKKSENQLAKLYKKMKKLGERKTLDTAEKEKALSLYRLSQDPLFRKNMRAAANAAQARAKKLPRKARRSAFGTYFNEALLKLEPRALAFASGGKLRAIAQGNRTFSCERMSFHLLFIGKSFNDGRLKRGDATECESRTYGPGLFVGGHTAGFCSGELTGTAIGLSAVAGAILAPGIGISIGEPGLCVSLPSSFWGFGAYAGIQVIDFDY